MRSKENPRWKDVSLLFDLDVAKVAFFRFSCALSVVEAAFMQQELSQALWALASLRRWATPRWRIDLDVQVCRQAERR